MVVVAAPSLHGVDLVVELILVVVVKLIWIAAVRLQFGGCAMMPDLIMLELREIWNNYQVKESTTCCAKAM